MRSQRRGFTLMELMVTMAIIGILASMVMGAMYVSQQQAREARTRALVQKLHESVMLRWESYRTRRIGMTDAQVEAARVHLSLPTPLTLEGMAWIRLNAMRELHRMEMPDRWTDIEDDPVILGRRPSISAAYERRRSGGTPTELNQAAECLYLIVTMGVINDDVGGRDAWKDRDIADTDNDDYPEFIDGYGNPIRFLRWAPGFVSQLQPDSDAVTAGTQRDAINNHDPFDYARVDMPVAGGQTRGWQMFPLIYSDGADGFPDIIGEIGDGDAFQYSTTDPPNDPYHYDSSQPAGQEQIGAPFDVNDDSTMSDLDNIHNHALQVRLR